MSPRHKRRRTAHACRFRGPQPATGPSILSFPEEVLQKIFHFLHVNPLTTDTIQSARHAFALAQTNTRLMKIFRSCIETISVHMNTQDRVPRGLSVAHLQRIAFLAGRALKTLHVLLHREHTKLVLASAIVWCPNVENLSFSDSRFDHELSRSALEKFRLKSLSLHRVSEFTLSHLASLSYCPSKLGLIKLPNCLVDSVSKMLTSTNFSGLKSLHLDVFRSQSCPTRPLRNLITSVCRLARVGLNELEFRISVINYEPDYSEPSFEVLVAKCSEYVAKVRTQEETFLKSVKVGITGKTIPFVFGVLPAASCDACVEVTYIWDSHCGAVVEFPPGGPPRFKSLPLQANWFSGDHPPDFSHLRHLCLGNYSTRSQEGNAAALAFLNGDTTGFGTSLSLATNPVTICCHVSRRPSLTDMVHLLTFALSRAPVTHLKLSMELLCNVGGEGTEDFWACLRRLRVLRISWYCPFDGGCYIWFAKYLIELPGLLRRLEGGRLERFLVDRIDFGPRISDIQFLRRDIRSALNALDRFEQRGIDVSMFKCQMLCWWDLSVGGID